MELIDWHGDTSSADYQRLVRGITAIVGQPLQKKVKAETDYMAEEEDKKKADAEAKRMEEEQRAKAEEKHRRKEKQKIKEIKADEMLAKPGFAEVKTFKTIF